MNTELIALVPAAGVGSRAVRPGQQQHVPKQYQPIHGQPMLRHTVRALLAEDRIAQVCVVVAPDDPWVESALQGLPRCSVLACGGKTRAETVLNGLRHMALSARSWVLVHDAARPGLPLDALSRLIDQCSSHAVGGLLALPVPDTVKRAATVSVPGYEAHTMRGAPAVQTSVDRAGLWLAQTPQMFRAHLLQLALEQAGPLNPLMTDESSALELAGYQPLLVQGSPRNFKVTWPQDFEAMHMWLMHADPAFDQGES